MTTWYQQQQQQGGRGMQEQNSFLTYPGVNQYYASLPPSRVDGQMSYQRSYVPRVSSRSELTNARAASQPPSYMTGAQAPRGTSPEVDEEATVRSSSTSPTEDNSDDDDDDDEDDSDSDESSSSSYDSSSSSTTSSSSVSSSSNDSMSSLFAVRPKQAPAERPLSRNGNRGEDEIYSMAGLDIIARDAPSWSSPSSNAPNELNDNAGRPGSRGGSSKFKLFSHGSSANVFTNKNDSDDDDEDNNADESKLGLTRSAQDDLTRHPSRRRLSRKVSFTDDIILRDATPQERRPSSRGVSMPSQPSQSYAVAMPQPQMRYMIVPQRQFFVPQHQFFVPQRELVVANDAAGPRDGKSRDETFLPPLHSESSPPPSRHMSRSSSQLSAFMRRLKSSLSFRRHHSIHDDSASPESPDTENEDGRRSDMTPQTSYEATLRRHSRGFPAAHAGTEPTSSSSRYASRQIASAPPHLPRRPSEQQYRSHYAARNERGYSEHYKTLPSIPRSAQAQQQQQYYVTSPMMRQQQQQRAMQRPSFYYPYYAAQPTYGTTSGGSFFSAPFPRLASSQSLSRYPSQTYM